MWYFGIFTALLSSILGGLGDNLIRLSFTLEEELSHKERRPVILRPIWILGVLFSCILNAILIVTSLNFASAMIVTPFSGLHIFWSIIFSKYILNEKIKSRHYKGTGLVISGLLFIVLFGVKDVPVYSVYELSILYSQPKFVLYCFVNISFILICTYLSLFGLDGTEENKYENKIDINNAFTNNKIENNNIDKNENSINRKSIKDIIILNRNALHLKISNLRDYLTKSKYIEYEKNVSVMDNSELNYSSSENEIKTMDIKNDNTIDDGYMNSNSDIKYGFGRENSIYESDNMGFYNKLLNYINKIEKRIEIINSLFIELTKGFPRVKISIPIKRFCICSVSGLIGGYTNVLVQNLMQIILLDGVYTLIHKLTYQLLIMILITGSIQWGFWNAALSKYQAIFVVPIVNSVLIASSGFCNLMLYYDNHYVSNSLLGIFFKMNFLLGQSLILVGIYIISRANRTLVNENNLDNNDDINNHSVNEENIFDFSKNSQKSDPMNNKLYLFLESKFSNFADITSFFKAKKEKISSSLESLLGLSKNQNLSNNHSTSSLSNTKYSKNTNQFHINNTIILPQEEYDDSQSTCIHVDNCQAATANTGIQVEKSQINVEKNFPSLSNNINHLNQQEEMDIISQQIIMPISAEHSLNALSQQENISDIDYHKKYGIELESYVLDEYDIYDFETPFSNQDYTRREAIILQNMEGNCQYEDYVNEQIINTSSMLSFGDDILEENVTQNYYESDLMATKEIEYNEDFTTNNHSHTVNLGFNHNSQSNETEVNTKTSDLKIDCNPSLSTCSTNSTVLNSVITNIL
ncbi:Magnesium transporter NIPA family protein [Cryptosporidium meleagridis]|uniref:Magnesium transporter NIPA family protein n=1 Tax=Cryptosporidium meleagridis TaxID=93969 RepID=A0A2P4Z616_9CRYT|nr:Magnesium transporter NIPA family protein [Cryptosporidium meleagridis]